MAGRNQHHIPQFFQRGFAVDGSRGHKIWRFDKGRLPVKPRSICRTASEDNFYSEPSPDGSRTLDDEISDREVRMVEALSTLRKADVGSAVASEVAAELVCHLAPRAAHLRQSIELMMCQIVAELEVILTEKDNVFALIGLNHSAPNDIFRERVGTLLREDGFFASLPLPEYVVERIAFYLSKEFFCENLQNILPVFLEYFCGLKSESGNVARNSHNKVLRIQDGPGAYRALLQTFNWHIVPSPTEGAILPDCVALALDSIGVASPLMLTDIDNVNAVIMPLSSHLLLFGGRGDLSLPVNFAYNQEAARSCHHFFLSAISGDIMAELQPLIDEHPAGFVGDTVEKAFKEYVKDLPVVGTNCIGESHHSMDRDPEVETSSLGSYQLSFINCADESVAQGVGVSVKQVVDDFLLSMPLARLDGITFASDYASALRDVDRGTSHFAQPTTVDRDIGVGLAQTVNVVRNGVVMCRIVMDSIIARALISDNERQVDWAIGALVRQLAHVALVEIVDGALPGIMLQPIADITQRVLYDTVGGAVDGYITAHISSGIGDSEDVAEGFRQLLTEALDRMRTTILPARLAYRYHGNLNELLTIALPQIRYVLLFAADLLGHCAAQEMEPVPAGSALEVALEHAGLRLWLLRYSADLEAFRLRLGRWESVDEFFAFNIHVERLLWQHGMIPWSSAEGMRVEIPIGTDAEALMAGMKGDELETK